MARRHDGRFHEPTPTPLPRKPTAIVYRDAVGRGWFVRDLHGSELGLADCLPWDATHRGFAWESVRILYTFRPGDDRGTTQEVLGAQFTFGKRLPTDTERAMRAASRPVAQPPVQPMENRSEEWYRGRGMGRR